MMSEGEQSQERDYEGLERISRVASLKEMRGFSDAGLVRRHDAVADFNRLGWAVGLDDCLDELPDARRSIRVGVLRR